MTADYGNWEARCVEKLSNMYTKLKIYLPPTTVHSIAKLTTLSLEQIQQIEVHRIFDPFCMRTPAQWQNDEGSFDPNK